MLSLATEQCALICPGLPHSSLHSAHCRDSGRVCEAQASHWLETANCCCTYLADPSRPAFIDIRLSSVLKHPTIKITVWWSHAHLIAGDARQLLYACCANQHINIHRPVFVHARPSVATHQPHAVSFGFGLPDFFQQAGQAARGHPLLALSTRPQALGLYQILVSVLNLGEA